MLVAEVDGRRVTPAQVREDRALCPECGSEVVAVRGESTVHHWRHLVATGCSYAGETAWHMDWKMRFADVGEVEKVRDDARCDVWTPIRGMANPGRAFEFQSKPMDLDEMRERQRVWINVVWVFDGLGADIQSMGAQNGVLRAFSWNRMPHMIWKSINQWSGVGAQLYVHCLVNKLEVMLRVDEVEFGKGFDGAPRFWAEAETTDRFVQRYREEVAPRAAA